jgi:hypothetical protein
MSPHSNIHLHVQKANPSGWLISINANKNPESEVLEDWNEKSVAGPVNISGSDYLGNLRQQFRDKGKLL